MMDAVEQKRLDVERTAREVYDLRVYVVGGGFQYMKMFFDAGLRGARSVEDANIICFTGGSDVEPSFYGETKIPGTHSDPARDTREAVIYSEAVKLQKPMVGICRGSQFLNVMNGGKLWQDVDGHASREGHSVIDVKTGEVKHNMTSTHHQMMIPTEKADILAVADISLIKKNEAGTTRREKAIADDIEAVWYKDSLALCFQPHPEFAHGDCRNYFLDLFDEHILPAC